MSRAAVYIVARRKDGNPVEYLRVTGVAQYPEWTVNLNQADQMTAGRASVVQGAFGGTSFPFDGDLDALKRRIETEFGRDTIPPRRFGDGSFMAVHDAPVDDRVDALRAAVKESFLQKQKQTRPQNGLALFLASNSIYGKIASRPEPSFVVNPDWWKR